MFRKALFFPLVTAALLSSCQPGANNQPGTEVSFDNDWRFIQSDPANAFAMEFNDLDWKAVDLPHDWSVEDRKGHGSEVSGPFIKGMEGGEDVGHLKGGVGWYRKNFKVEEKDRGKIFRIYFDGVHSEADVWVNGKKAGEHRYGYTAFFLDITSLLNQQGDDNVIAVRVENPPLNSRWYPGAGIYRHVKLMVTESLHIGDWGTHILVSRMNDKSLSIDFETAVFNEGEEEENAQLEIDFQGPDETRIVVPGKEFIVKPGQQEIISLSTELVEALLWDIDSPQLYTVNIVLKKNGKIIEARKQSFGIRFIEWNAETGFILNGKPVLLKGACMHHDNGLLGAAAFDKAEARRVRIMKQNGYNAIRTSHNPPSTAFLDACDSIGMLVIDESFDAWQKPKRKNDYHKYFDEWWRQDLGSMVLRDRNHPSVIMWSFGNEIQERGDSSGLGIAAGQIELIKELDMTRPVTQAICEFWDNPGKEWDYAQPAFNLLDIGGYNYQWKRYRADHEDYPERLMFGSESVPKEAWENWKEVEENPWVIGDFVWTGMDYIGESGIGHVNYVGKEKQNMSFLQPWPWYVSWCGDIDITGNKKPQSWYRDVVWKERNLHIAVHEPVEEGLNEVVSFWGWPSEMASWNWKGNEGNMMSVRVFSSYPEVKLFLNDSLVGEKTIGEDDKLIAEFEVPYHDGELRAEGWQDEEMKESCVLKTTSGPASLRIIPESGEMKADKGDICYFRIEVLDENGLLIPDATIDLSAEVSGPAELIAAGNGSPELEGSIQDNRFKTFRGRALVILRSTGEPGTAGLKINGGEMEAVVETESR